MTVPLVTWIIYFSFYDLYGYTVCIFYSLLLKPILLYETSFYQNPVKYCNMATYCNTLKHNMQYDIDPYCFTPSLCDGMCTCVCMVVCEELVHSYTS